MSLTWKLPIGNVKILTWGRDGVDSGFVVRRSKSVN
jgi:hypothetical protein